MHQMHNLKIMVHNYAKFLPNKQLAFTEWCTRYVHCFYADILVYISFTIANFLQHTQYTFLLLITFVSNFFWTHTLTEFKKTSSQPVFSEQMSVNRCRVSERHSKAAKYVQWAIVLKIIQDPIISCMQLKYGVCSL